MFLQFFTARSFIVSKKDVIKVVRGTSKNETGESIIIRNKDVVELVDAKAKKLLERYSKECETWGVDAIKKQSVVKSKTAKQNKGTDRDIA